MLLQSKSNFFHLQLLLMGIRITNLWYMAQSKSVQSSICNRFSQHQQKKNRAERQQKREAEEIRRKSSLLSVSVTLWTYSKQKSYSAGKENQHQREARYDVSFHQSLAHKLKLPLYPAELLNYLSLLLCKIESIQSSVCSTDSTPDSSFSYRIMYFDDNPKRSNYFLNLSSDAFVIKHKKPYYQSLHLNCTRISSDEMNLQR